MHEETEEKPDFHGADDDIGAHKVRPKVKRLAAVAEEDRCVDSTVNQEEGDEKNPGEGHPVFLGD